MIFRRPKSYSITLKRAHSLLKIPRDSTASISGEVTHGSSVPSRDQIQEAFRAAAKRHHPDLAAAGAVAAAAQTRKLNADSARANANTTFRECHEARELLINYYVRRKFVHPEIVQSAKDNPPEDHADESLFSGWTLTKNNRSFQVEVFLRLSLCLGLAVGSYYHDLHVPERRQQQIKRRDAQYSQFGPQPRI